MEPTNLVRNYSNNVNNELGGPNSDLRRERSEFKDVKELGENEKD